MTISFLWEIELHIYIYIINMLFFPWYMWDQKPVVWWWDKNYSQPDISSNVNIPIFNSTSFLQRIVRIQDQPKDWNANIESAARVNLISN